MVDHEGWVYKHRGFEQKEAAYATVTCYLLGSELRKADTRSQSPVPVTDICYPEIPSILYFHDNWSFVSPQLLTFCYPFPSFSVSLINPSTPVGGVYSSPSLQSPFLSSFPSFHCFIYVSAREGLLIFPWKWNLIAVRNLVCLSVSHVCLVSLQDNNKNNKLPLFSLTPRLSSHLHNRYFFVTRSRAL
jgi:hypothetical protein